MSASPAPAPMRTAGDAVADAYGHKARAQQMTEALVAARGFASWEGEDDGYVGNGLCGSAASISACLAEIDEKEGR